MIARYTLILAVALALSGPGAAEAKKLSSSKPKVTQLRIIHMGQGPARITPQTAGGPSQPTAWGITSNYIGPGDIRRLQGITIYVDAENRITAVKIVRESYNGDMVTSIFTKVVELSIQTLQPGMERPHKETPITIYTADSVTFP